jgi:site-specific DNA-methyltransferase (adenine-specific)
MSVALLHGDCLDRFKDIPDGSVDLIICDLPYGCLSGRAIGKAAENKGCFSGNANGCDWDVKIDLEAFWREVKRIRKSEHSPCIHFCTTKFGAELIQSNPAEFRYDLVWDKQRGVSFLSANKMPMRSHEMIYVFSKAGAYYNRVDISGNFKEHRQYGKPKSESVYGVLNRKKPIIRAVGTVTSTADKRCALSVIPQLNTSTKRGSHPTEKPMELYKWLIQRYSPPGGFIVDPTAGSFNSCWAGWDLDRHCIGIEKDKAFYDKAVLKAETLNQ